MLAVLIVPQAAFAHVLKMGHRRYMLGAFAMDGD